MHTDAADVFGIPRPMTGRLQFGVRAAKERMRSGHVGSLTEPALVPRALFDPLREKCCTRVPGPDLRRHSRNRVPGLAQAGILRWEQGELFRAVVGGGCVPVLLYVSKPSRDLNLLKTI